MAAQKRISRAIICAILLVFLVPIILAFVFFKCLPYIEGQYNKKVIMAYIEERYGGDYEIVEEYLGRLGALGTRDDSLTILYNGTEYTISAKDGVITRDDMKDPPIVYP